MDHWKKVYELGGRLGFVRGLFEFTANHVHYQITRNIIPYDQITLDKFCILLLDENSIL